MHMLAASAARVFVVNHLKMFSVRNNTRFLGQNWKKMASMLCFGWNWCRHEWLHSKPSINSRRRIKTESHGPKWSHGPKLDRLQATMNTAARLIYGIGKFDRIQHLISERLHWLPVHKRVQFKLCLLAYKAVHGLAPHYLADMSSVDARRRLRSATCEDLVIPRTATKFGARSFAVAAPSEWNRLLLHIRSKPSVNCFKVALKSFLFTTDSS